MALTLFVYFASRKFHSGFGIIDYTVVGTGMEVRMKCSKGWEWWLSIVWQLFWSWVYAPWILFKSRGIRDVHGWRLQTMICCVAGYVLRIACSRSSLTPAGFPHLRSGSSVSTLPHLLP